MAKNSQDKSLRDGSWTSSQWYSNERVDAAPRQWAPADGVPYTHLAYITGEEIELLKRAAKKRGTELVLHNGPEGVSFFAPKSTKIENLEGSEDTANDVPVKWKSSPDHPTAYLVYVTDAQAEFLKEMDIHDSGVDKHDHYGPDNVPSYQGDGGGGGSDGGSDGGGWGGDTTGGLAGLGLDLGSVNSVDLGTGALSFSADSDLTAAQAAQDAAFAAAAAQQDAANAAAAQAAQDAANAAAAQAAQDAAFAAAAAQQDAANAAAAQAAQDAANAAAAQAAQDAAFAAAAANQDAANAAAAQAAQDAAAQAAADQQAMVDALDIALSNTDLSQMAQAEVDAISHASLEALSSAEVGKAELDAVAQALAEAGVSSKGLSFSNLTLSNVLSALAIAAGKTTGLGAVAALAGLAGKAFGDKGLAQAGQVAGLIGSIASGNVAGALASLGSLTGSSGLATTGALAGLANAISSGNVVGALASAGQITGITGLSQASQALSAMNAAEQGNALGALSGFLGATGLGGMSLGQLAGGTTGAGSNVGDAGSFGGDSGGTTTSATTSDTTTAGGTTTGGAPSSLASKTGSDAGSLAALFGMLGAPSVLGSSVNSPTVEQESFASQSAPPPYEKMAKFKGPLDEFLEMVEKTSYLPEKTAAKPRRVEPVSQRIQIDQPATSTPDMANYFNYGQETDIDRVLAGIDTPYQFKAGGMATPMMSHGGGLDIIHHSGKPRLDFRKGAAVSGPGDGQSDDIPAMLADGEFVFPADVVAALGNGSTKAGSDKLYKMMHEIRAYHRSAKPKDLPPPAKKSPLDYLKGQSKGRRS